MEGDCSGSSLDLLIEMKTKALAGDVKEQLFLGMMYYFGDANGANKDSGEAVKWYRMPDKDNCHKNSYRVLSNREVGL